VKKYVVWLISIPTARETAADPYLVAGDDAGGRGRGG
jgi:hypothetical protein